MTNDWYLAADDTTAVANDNGIARGVYIPDPETDRDVRRDFFAPKGQGGVFGSTNVHHVVRLYDSNGNKTNEWYVAVDDESGATSDEGIARRVFAYDPETNREIRRDLFAPNGQGGVFGWTNVHHVVQLFDGNGNMTNSWYLAADDATTTTNANGISRIISFYEPGTDRMIRCDFFAPEGRKGIFGDPNIHHDVWLFDGNGNITNVWHLTTKDIKGNTRWGYAEVRRSYPSKCVTYWDADGNQLDMEFALFCSIVHLGYNASLAGVEAGDVILRFGSHDIRQSLRSEKEAENMRTKVIKETRNHEKELLVARNNGNRWEILPFRFSSQAMGVTIGIQPISKEIKKAIIHAWENSVLPSEDGPVMPTTQERQP